MFQQILESRIIQARNPICFGMDPILEKIPVEGTPEEKIRSFYLKILDELDRQNIYPAAAKPNIAFYEAISLEALWVLKQLITSYQERGILVILDAKRGDIGKTSAAYASAVFNNFSADAVTVNPYMGSDSVLPFLNYDVHKGVYGLMRTSNQGAQDFQDLILQDKTPLYQKVGEQFCAWDNGSMGAVVGATNPGELEEITAFFENKKHPIPFLIPGISVKGVSGGQGGSLSEVLQALKNGGAKNNWHLINSSSGLNYAYEAKPHLSYAKACVEALQELSEEAEN